MIPLKGVKFEGCSVSEPAVFKHNDFAPAFTTKNVFLGRSLISSQVKKTCQ